MQSNNTNNAYNQLFLLTLFLHHQYSHERPKLLSDTEFDLPTSVLMLQDDKSRQCG